MIYQETPLNIDLGIKNEGQDYKIGPVREWVFVDKGRVNGGDKGE
jgi:hypothetical protein